MVAALLAHRRTKTVTGAPGGPRAQALQEAVSMHPPWRDSTTSAGAPSGMLATPSE